MSKHACIPGPRALRGIFVGFGLAARCLAAQAGQGWHVTVMDPQADGSQPGGQLLMLPDGSALGTARTGGPSGAGTVFELDPSGKVSLLHAFAGADGYGPLGGLARGTDGNYYGTTALGGDHGLGVVFRIALNGTFAVVHSFDDSADQGASGTLSTLTLGPDGAFYGTSPQAASYPEHTGALYRVTMAGELTILHIFDTHVRQPQAGVTFTPDGRLYGLASSDGRTDCGILFSSQMDGSDFRTEHLFDHRREGCNPVATMVLGADHLLYGTTQYGGPRGAVGGLFSYDPASAAFTALHSFHDDDPVGNDPSAGVTIDAKGNLYGATAFGGPQGNGSVYKRTKEGHLVLLHAFAGNGKDGTNPGATPVLDGKEQLVGNTVGSGADGAGTLYRLQLPKKK